MHILIRPLEHYMNKLYNQRVVNVAEVVCGVTSGGEPRPGGGLLFDMARRIERAREDDLEVSTKAKLIAWRGDFMYLRYCVQGGEHDEKDMVVTVGEAASDYFFILGDTTTPIHSNASSAGATSTNKSDQSSLSSKFDTMRSELLPKSDFIAIGNEALHARVTPPEGYYLCCTVEKYCSYPYVQLNGPFYKVTDYPWKT